MIAGDYRLAAGLRLHCRHTEHFQFPGGHGEDVAGVVDSRHIGVVQWRQIDAASFLDFSNQRAKMRVAEQLARACHHQCGRTLEHAVGSDEQVRAFLPAQAAYIQNHGPRIHAQARAPLLAQDRVRAESRAIHAVGDQGQLAVGQIPIRLVHVTAIVRDRRDAVARQQAATPRWFADPAQVWKAPPGLEMIIAAQHGGRQAGGLREPSDLRAVVHVNHARRTTYNVLYEAQRKLCAGSAQITDGDTMVVPPTGLRAARVHDDALPAASLRLGQFDHATLDGAAEPRRQRKVGRPHVNDHRQDLQDTCVTAMAQSQGTNAKKVSGNHDVDAVAN